MSNHSSAKIAQEQESARAERFAEAGSTLFVQFNRTGVLSDLEKAIQNLQQAVLLTPDGHANKPGYTNNLGIAYEKRFGYTGSPNDLEDAIENLRQAVSLTPDSHASKPKYLNNLGHSLGNWFMCTGSLSDIEEAIKNQQQAISLTPDGHANKPGRLGDLGDSFQSRFKHTGSLSDLEEAIKYQRQAVLLIPDDRANKPLYLGNLGISFESRFRHTGSLSDLEEAIKNQQQAVLITPDGHTDKPGRLNSLGNTLQSRFWRMGSLSDLEDAIKHKQQAVSLTPDNHVEKPNYINDLGVSFDSRFRLRGSLSDLEEATKNFQQAVALTPDGHAKKPIHLSNLGVSFWSQFERTRSLGDLEEAIKYQQQVVLLTPDGHSNKPRYLINLGMYFESRFECTGALSDIEEAIKIQQQAVLLTPDGHTDKPQYLGHLGDSFRHRFGQTGSLSDSEEAMKNLQQSLSLTPAGHADKTGRLGSLGILCLSRFLHTGLQDDLAEGVSYFQLAATSNIGPVSLRCHAAQCWARSEAASNSPSTLVAYRHAINLLPQVAWMGDPIATRHSRLTTFGHLPREAAAVALDAGHTDLALEWLEQGRSVVWNQLFHLRTPIDDLRQAHPDICVEFTDVSHELQSAATRGCSVITPNDANHSNSLQEETQRHHRLAEKWDLLLKKIRSLPDFEDFLHPKKVSVLKEAAKSGPVVVINVHQRRCDALVLDRGRDNILHIPLKRLHYGDLERMQKYLNQYLGNPHRAQRWADRAGAPAPTGSSSPMAAMLELLYLSIVHPIFQALGMTTHRSDSADLPRIWWCPTGLLTFFPLHAACVTTRTGIDGVFNYAISSYTPTVNALLEARAVKQQPFNRLAGIAMIDTPHQQSLPGVEREIMKIAKVFSNGSERKFEILRNEQATGEQVLAHMANSSWVHFACHGVQDGREPTRSGFCLHDRRLTITDIVGKPFGHADLAFLSACETATGDEKVSDEAVHITGAMLGSGYRNVIGTMWAIPDEVAPGIAAKVYEILLSGGEPNSDQAAQALHEALKEVRDESHDVFNFWVPFVHYGA